MEHDISRRLCICLWWRQRHGKRRSHISPHNSSRTGLYKRSISTVRFSHGFTYRLVFVSRDQWIQQKQRALWRICKWVEDIWEMYGNESHIHCVIYCICKRHRDATSRWSLSLWSQTKWVSIFLFIYFDKFYFFIYKLLLYTNKICIWCEMGICETVMLYTKSVPLVWIFHVASNILGQVLSPFSCGLYASIAKWLIMMWWRSILLKLSSWFGSAFWWLRKETWDEWTEWYGVVGWGGSIEFNNTSYIDTLSWWRKSFPTITCFFPLPTSICLLCFFFLIN